MASTESSSSAPTITPKEFYIFGSGISFSISPTIHNAGFAHHNLPHSYTIAESPSIDDVAHLIHSPSIGGASVTMPHKLQVSKFCDEQTETARVIGSINTLIISDGDQENTPEEPIRRRIIVGDNTDWSGLYAIIKKYKELTGTITQRAPKTGLVIGAGGASRAALYALYRAGVESIYLANRTVSVADKVRSDFAGLFEISVLPLSDLFNLPSAPDVIIGTVPADTTNQEQFEELFLGQVQGLCIDMSYKPRRTPLLTAAGRHKGWTGVTGVEVLLAQAFDQYRLWTGIEAPKEGMVNAVLDREEMGGDKKHLLSML
ncbi:hypothetical protein BDV19DRAFT_376340 [Aspergillus venezuelensis]